MVDNSKSPWMGNDKIKAPFTKEQVMFMSQWQNCGYVHPFTCGNGCSADLIPTVRGWICQYCDYTLDWAYVYMGTTPPVYLLNHYIE